MSTSEQIRQLLEAHVEPPDDDAAPLALRSFELVAVAEALEERFGIRVRAVDLSPENFGSIARLASFVEQAAKRRA